MRIFIIDSAYFLDDSKKIQIIFFKYNLNFFRIIKVNKGQIDLYCYDRFYILKRTF